MTWYYLLFAILIAMAVSHPLKVMNGRITTDGNRKCEISANGIKVEGRGIIPGLHFGIIEYNCENVTGLIVSKASCSDCGMYCAVNQLILECQQTGTLMLIGMLIGLIPTLVISILLRRVIWSMGSVIIDKITLYYDNKKDDIEMNRIETMNKRSPQGITFQPSFKEPMTIKKKYISNLNNKREQRAGYVVVGTSASQFGAYNDGLCTSTSRADIHYDRPLPSVPSAPKEAVYEQTTEPRYSTPSKPYNRAATALTVLALASSVIDIPSVNACDNTLFVHSQGKVCEKNGRCVTSGIYQMSLSSGSTVCFKDTNNSLMTVRMGLSYYRDRYSIQYYTSGYSLDVKTASECKSDGGACWNNQCSHGSKNVALSYLNPHHYPESVGCSAHSLGCDTWCWHKTACTWWHWILKPVGEKYPVYKRIGRIWEIEVHIDTHDSHRKYIINTNNPRVDLDGFNYKLPIYITNFSGEDKKSDDGLIIVEGVAYPVVMSQKNMPERDIIGDYQISINNDEYAFNPDSVICKPESCKANCIAPESKMLRTIEGLKDIESVKHKFIENKWEIEAQVTVQGTMTLMIGNMNFDSLYVEHARCEIDIPTTYSCIGCTTKSYAVIQAYDIRSPGLVPFISNCTFETDYVACTPEPLKLVQSSDYKTCMLTFPSMNSSIVLNFNFTYAGTLSPAKFLVGRETIQDTLASIASNPDFWASLSSTFAFGTLGIFVTSLLMRIIKIVMIARFSTPVIQGQGK